MFLKNRNIISKSKRSKVTYYAALREANQDCSVGREKNNSTRCHEKYKVEISNKNYLLKKISGGDLGAKHDE